MGTEDAPFSCTQATWARAGEDSESKIIKLLQFFCFLSIDLAYFVIFSCLLKILSYQE